MLLPLRFIPGIRGILDEEDIEKCMENQELTERLRRSLYYGKVPTTDRPSLPVTEIAVEFFQEAAPRELGRVDTFIASSYGRRACMSPCAMMLGMVYIERLKKRNPEYLRNVSSSDLFLISMMMASKYLYDEGVDEEVFNDEWADSANMDLDQLNELERNFLNAIDWSLFVQPEEFWRMLRKVERRIAWGKGWEHGFFNYTDLLVLSENGMLFKIVKALMMEISKVMLVCSVAYAAGVLSVVGSTASVLYARQQLPAPTEIHIPFPTWHRLTDSVFRATLLPELEQAHQDILQPTDKLQHVKSAHKESRLQANKTHTERGFNGNKSTKDEEYRRKGQLSGSLQLPGFLTLVMLKDTVLKFVSGLQTKYSTNGHSKGTPRLLTDTSGHSEHVLDNFDSEIDSEVSDMICSCGCCGQNSGFDRLCYNLTSPFGNYGTDQAHNGHWTSNRPKLKLGHGQKDLGTENFGCSPDYACQCCCAVTQSRDWVRSTYGADLLKTTLSFLRIEEPFAGMTFGFGTSSSMAAAAG